MSTIDHKAEAEAAASAGQYDIARYHAAMLQAEQQRLASQIAYVMLLETQYSESAKNPTKFDNATRKASVARHTLVLAQIRQGLGLA